jgi:hypothetical protein
MKIVKLNPASWFVIKILGIIFANWIWFAIALPRLVNAHSDTYLGIGITMSIFAVLIDLLIIGDFIFTVIVDQISKAHRE